MEEPKEEPLDDFPSIQHGNMILNTTEFLGEPKEEPLELINSNSVDNEDRQVNFDFDNICKEEEMLDGEEVPIIPPLSLFSVKDEPMDDFIYDQKQISSLPYPMEPKDEPLDESLQFHIEDQNPISSLPYPMESKDEPLDDFLQYSMDNQKSDESLQFHIEDQISPGTVSHKRSSIDSAQSEPVTKKWRINRIGETDMVCPKCDYHTRSVCSWIQHLRLKHSTTATQAGVALLCECGHESYSPHHSLMTNHMNYTVIRKRDAPVERRENSNPISDLPNSVEPNDEPLDESLQHSMNNQISLGHKISSSESSQSESSTKKSWGKWCGETDMDCPKCDYRTKSVYAWINHLVRIHSTTPTKEGLALLCECGNVSFSVTHFDMTNHMNYTVIAKRDESVERQANPEEEQENSLEKQENPANSRSNKCVLCEKHPMNARSYAKHLITDHDSSLKANGIYLLCPCGLKFYTNMLPKNHSKECDGRKFSIHKLVDDEDKQGENTSNRLQKVRVNEKQIVRKKKKKENTIAALWNAHPDMSSGAAVAAQPSFCTAGDELPKQSEHLNRELNGIWTYFDQLVIERESVCILCGFTTILDNHGTMWSHLKDTHAAEYGILKWHEDNQIMQGLVYPGTSYAVPGVSIPCHLTLPRPSDI